MKMKTQTSRNKGTASTKSALALGSSPACTASSPTVLKKAAALPSSCSFVRTCKDREPDENSGDESESTCWHAWMPMSHASLKRRAPWAGVGNILRYKYHEKAARANYVIRSCLLSPTNALNQLHKLHHCHDLNKVFLGLYFERIDEGVHGLRQLTGHSHLNFTLNLVS